MPCFSAPRPAHALLQHPLTNRPLRGVLPDGRDGPARFRDGRLPGTTRQPASYHTLPDRRRVAQEAEPSSGFKATLFAAEPDVNNPIACCWDEKGRLWVAENFTYSDTKERYDMKLRDRILIFEDTDNDGKYDKRTVFSDEVQMLTSIERGLGGVWAVCPPHLLFIPDKDGDDKPDGPPQVMLDGFSTQAASRHTFANG
nr:PVC-type heme-binding CxxCH protein [Verrucomicrobium spinosum]